MWNAKPYLIVYALICMIGLVACSTERNLNSNTKIEVYSKVNDPQWLADRERISHLPPLYSCQKLWDILWLWSKKGNLEARYYLTGTMFDTPIKFPGYEMKDASVLHQYMLMGLYSLGYNNGSAFSKELPMMIYGHFKAIKSPSNEDFFKCLEKAPSQQCMQIAVQKKIAPSFEVFSKGIDDAIASGEKPYCHFSSDVW